LSLIELTLCAFSVAAALCLIMASAWYLQHRSGKTGWIDTTWSLGVGGVAFIAAVWPLEPDWPHWRQMVVAVLAGSWCLRLGLHIAERNSSVVDDPRYRNLIMQWGGDASRRMFWFLQSQAMVGVILAVSIALAAHNPNPQWRIQDLIGLAVLTVAIAGESIADRQLRAFKNDPANHRAVCDIGLWRWSRHPNYFFEWLTWVTYPTIAIDLSGHNPYGWAALAAPFCMYWVLVHVSGIPPLEDHMLRSRGDVFRAYQKRTRAFFPLPLFNSTRPRGGE
jgi:steroid 5-alpha reductase family enzyme